MAKQGQEVQLVAVVVTHNRLDQLRMTLQRLWEVSERALARVVVVDNASTDGTGAWLATRDASRLDVITSPDNIGGAGGFERGMRHAVAAYDPTWIVLMDDDARPSPGTLERFQSEDRSNAQAWAAAVYYPDGRICDINRPSRNPFWHVSVFWRTLFAGRSGFHLGPADYVGTAHQDVDGSSFVGLFVSRVAVGRAGYPDGQLFIYGDDVLYTMSLRADGGRILFDPALQFEHDYTTQVAGERRMHPLWKVYYHHRNLLFVYRMAAGVWLWPLLLLILPKWVLKYRHYSGEKRVFLRVLGRAVRDGLRRDSSLKYAQVQALARENFAMVAAQENDPQK